MAWASICVSLVALLLATTSLWVTSLARADIAVYHVPKLDKVTPGTFTGGLMKTSQLRLTLFVANGGARAGLLESLSFSNLSSESAPPWGRCEYRGSQSVSANEAAFGSFALKAGETETINIEVGLEAVGLSAEEEAKRISSLDGLSATIEWSFFRASGPLQRFASKRSRHESVRITRSLEITIDTRAYRQAVIGHWRHNKPTAYLAVIAEGGDASNLA